MSLEQLKKIAANEVENEATAFPWWAITETIVIGMSRGQEAMLAGPFFSRETAQAQLDRYNYSKRAHVFCFSGYFSRDYKETLKELHPNGGK